MGKHKGNPSKVHPALAREAIKRAKDRQSVYSQCIKLWFRQTGKLDTGFNNVDLQAWIDENAPDAFKPVGEK